jgi:hypothetical protein
MAFRDFGFRDVQAQFGLRFEDLYSTATSLTVRDDFAAFIRDGTAARCVPFTES